MLYTHDMGYEKGHASKTRSTFELILQILQRSDSQYERLIEDPVETSRPWFLVMVSSFREVTL